MSKKLVWSDKHDFYVNVAMFKVDIVFVVNCNKKEVVLALKKACGKNYKHFNIDSLDGWDDDTTYGRMIDFRGGFIVLLKGDGGGFRTFVSIMAHEITHVVQYLLRDRRIPLNKHTEEVYAYLTEYITREALLKLYY